LSQYIRQKEYDPVCPPKPYFSFGGNCKTDVAGGIPLYQSEKDLEPIGSIGVSGPSQDIDEEVAKAGAEAISYDLSS